MSNEENIEVLEDDVLQPVEVKLEDLSTEDIIRIIKDKDAELDNYKHILDQTQNNNKELATAYNEDMSYMSTINSNVVKVQRKKEDAIKMIIGGALNLLTIDREVIAPERKENN